MLMTTKNYEKKSKILLFTFSNRKHRTQVSIIT